MRELVDVQELESPPLEAAGPDLPEEARTGVFLSVIVPVSERPEPLVPLYREYATSLRKLERPFEFVFVVEPWHRSLAEPLRELAAAGEPVRIYVVGQRAGEAALLRLAARCSQGKFLLTLPAYYRVDADRIGELVAALEAGADMAVARRWPRRDSWLNRLQTRAFHALLGRLARGRIHDIACGVQAMRRAVLAQLPLYGDFFRFLPLLAVHEGYRVVEVALPQHREDRRTRVYHPGVYLRRLLDVFALFFLFRFTYKPLRFFGLLGSAFAAAGGAVLGVLFVQRLSGQGIADRPLLLLGVLLLTLGVQAIALGLIGEIIVHLNVPGRRIYRVRGDGEEGASS